MKNIFKTRYRIETELYKNCIYYVARKKSWHNFHWVYLGSNSYLNETKNIVELHKAGKWPIKPQVTEVVEVE